MIEFTVVMSDNQMKALEQELADHDITDHLLVNDYVMHRMAAAVVLAHRNGIAKFRIKELNEGGDEE